MLLTDTIRKNLEKQELNCVQTMITLVSQGFAINEDTQTVLSINSLLLNAYDCFDIFNKHQQNNINNLYNNYTNG